jgi:hypothetical protein
VTTRKTPASTTLGLLTTQSLSNVDDGRRFFQMLERTTPFLLPEKYDFREPIRSVFDIEHLDAPLKIWNDRQYGCFLWRRVKPSVLGSYWPAQPRHPVDAIYMTVRGRNYTTESMRELLLGMAKAYRPLIAYVNRTYDGDLVDNELYGTHIMPLGQGLSLHALKNGLPTLPWAAVFGPEYIDSLSEQRLMSAPAFLVKPVGDCIYLQLTEQLEEGEVEYTKYVDIRQRNIDHLGATAFVGTARDSLKIPGFIRSLPY